MVPKNKGVVGYTHKHQTLCIPCRKHYGACPTSVSLLSWCREFNLAPLHSLGKRVNVYIFHSLTTDFLLSPLVPKCQLLLIYAYSCFILPILKHHFLLLALDACCPCAQDKSVLAQEHDFETLSSAIVSS